MAVAGWLGQTGGCRVGGVGVGRFSDKHTPADEAILVFFGRRCLNADTLRKRSCNA